LNKGVDGFGGVRLVLDLEQFGGQERDFSGSE